MPADRWTSTSRRPRSPLESESGSMPSSEDETDTSSPSAETSFSRRRPPSAVQGLRNTTSGLQKLPSSQSKTNGSQRSTSGRTDGNSGSNNRNTEVSPTRRLLPSAEAAKKRKWQSYSDRYKAIVDETHLQNRGKRPIPDRDESNDE